MKRMHPNCALAGGGEHMKLMASQFSPGSQTTHHPAGKGDHTWH